MLSELEAFCAVAVLTNDPSATAMLIKNVRRIVMVCVVSMKTTAEVTPCGTEPSLPVRGAAQRMDRVSTQQVRQKSKTHRRSRTLKQSPI